MPDASIIDEIFSGICLRPAHWICTGAISEFMWKSQHIDMEAKALWGRLSILYQCEGISQAKANSKEDKDTYQDP